MGEWLRQGKEKRREEKREETNALWRNENKGSLATHPPTHLLTYVGRRGPYDEVRRPEFEPDHHFQLHDCHHAPGCWVRGKRREMGGWVGGWVGG